MLIEDISFELGLDGEYVEGIARSASRRYKTYYIPKRTGGERRIDHPSAELKALQRWLNLRVLSRFPVHESATAYEQFASTRKNAAPHARSKFLLRLDFRDFFPSILRKDIFDFLKASMSILPNGWSDRDSRIFVSLVSRGAGLTIGAPTSPKLSNRICFDLDTKLKSLASDRDCKYTRYADDLFFSTSQPNVLREVSELTGEVIRDLVCPASLRLNPSKTLNLSRGRRRLVTGVVLASDGSLSIGRQTKRRIRSMIHQWDALDPDEKRWVSGMLSYSLSVEPEFVNRLYVKHGSGLVDSARRFNSQESSHET